MAIKNGRTTKIFPSSFGAVVGSGIQHPRYGMDRNQDPESGINISDPQYCLRYSNRPSHGRSPLPQIWILPCLIWSSVSGCIWRCWETGAGNTAPELGQGRRFKGTVAIARNMARPQRDMVEQWKGFDENKNRWRLKEFLTSPSYLLFKMKFTPRYCKKWSELHEKCRFNIQIPKKRVADKLCHSTALKLNNYPVPFCNFIQIRKELHTAHLWNLL